MNEWMRCTIGDLCDSVSITYRGKHEQVVLINTSDVLEGEILNHALVENKNLRGQFKKTFQKEDILYSEIRPANKRFAFVDTDRTENYIASTKLMVLRPKKSVVRPRYLFAILKSNTIINELQHLAETRSGTFPQITFSTELAPMEILLPDFDTQDRIVSLLDALEGKIANNKAINNNLFNQATALLESMFPNISHGDKTIGDFITPKRGKNLLSKNAIQGEVPVVAGGLEPATYHNEANTTAPVLAISASGANAGFVSLWNDPIWSSDSSFIDSSMSDDVYFWYVLLKKRQKEIYDSQTGSAQPHIYPQHIAIMPIVDLNAEQVTKYTCLVTPLFELMGANLNENKRLNDMIRTICPLLMSGELDVSEVEI